MQAEPAYYAEPGGADQSMSAEHGLAERQYNHQNQDFSQSNMLYD